MRIRAALLGLLRVQLQVIVKFIPHQHLVTTLDRTLDISVAGSVQFLGPTSGLRRFLVRDER
jgi:hypothetical protein